MLIILPAEPDASFFLQLENFFPNSFWNVVLTVDNIEEKSSAVVSFPSHADVVSTYLSQLVRKSLDRILDRSMYSLALPSVLLGFLNRLGEPGEEVMRSIRVSSHQQFVVVGVKSNAIVLDFAYRIGDTLFVDRLNRTIVKEAAILVNFRKAELEGMVLVVEILVLDFVDCPGVELVYHILLLEVHKEHTLLIKGGKDGSQVLVHELLDVLSIEVGCSRSVEDVVTSPVDDSFLRLSFLSLLLLFG